MIVQTMRWKLHLHDKTGCNGEMSHIHEQWKGRKGSALEEEPNNSEESIPVIETGPADRC
jgi:hypothetical protein